MIASGIATLPMSCSEAACAEVRELVAFDAEPSADFLDELGDAVVVVAQLWVALGERAHQHVAALTTGGRAAGVLLLIHGLVGLAHRLCHVAGVLRDHDRSECGGDREALALLGERAAGSLLDRVPVRGVGDDAELVSAWPVGATAELADGVGRARRPGAAAARLRRGVRSCRCSS